jgi:hypothetical protein
MAKPINAEQVRSWIDDELVEDVDRIPDDAAEFNFTIEMSNILIHIIRRQPEGPLLIGQQIEYDDEIRSRIRKLSEAEQNDLVARIRETLTTVPVVYGFHDEHDNNVRFRDMYRIFLEHRIYPDAMDQHTLMSGLVDVWKAMRYLDDIMALIDSVENG